MLKLLPEKAAINSLMTVPCDTIITYQLEFWHQVVQLEIRPATVMMD
ncbi:MAG: hypothetical protein V7K35_02960 [Nostoc sp.]